MRTTPAQLDALRDLHAGRPPRRRDVLARLVTAGLVDVEVHYRRDVDGLHPDGVAAALTPAGRTLLAAHDEPAHARAGMLF